MASVAAAPPPARAAAAMDQKAAVAAFSPGFIQQQQSNQHSKQQQQEQNNNGNGQQQEALRCPRCDSSNTKFCYYNNYSLSQPRHFCKACKRYWTRGGTLRSVPVGGGCRKNKRVRRHPNNNNNNSSSTTNNTSSNNNINLREGSVNSLPVVGGGHPIHDLMISSPTNNNPLYYGSNNHNLMNFPFSRYDLQIPPPPPQMNGFGLGFSSSSLVHIINGDEVNFRNLHNNNNNNNNNNNKQIFQDLISTTTPPTISSFLASTFQMKGGGGGNNNFETILPSYDEGSDGIYTKEEVVKTEVEGQNGSSLDHDPQEWCGSSRNGHQMDHQQQMGGSSPSCDPSLIWGSGPNLGAWLDPSTNNNLSSSSLTSLI